MSLITQGLIYGLSADAYNPHPSFRNSQMKWLEPEHAPIQAWHHSYLNPARPDLKGCPINTGKLFHLAQEDSLAFHKVKVLDGSNGTKLVRRTSKPGFIGVDQMEAILTLQAKLRTMPLIQQAVAEGQPEVSLFAAQPTPYGDLPVRCRPDLLTPTLEVHWKTVSRMEYLGEHIARMRYVKMLAYYRRVRQLLGLAPVRQIMVFCQAYTPHEIRVIEPSSYFTDRDSDNWKYGTHCINRFAQLLNDYGASPWPDYRNMPQDICTDGVGGKFAIKLPSSYDKRLAA